MSHAGFASKTRTTKNYRERHREIGLCDYCMKKVIKGLTYCKYHQEYFKKRKYASSQKNVKGVKNDK